MKTAALYLVKRHQQVQYLWADTFKTVITSYTEYKTWKLLNAYIRKKVEKIVAEKGLN